MFSITANSGFISELLKISDKDMRQLREGNKWLETSSVDLNDFSLGNINFMVDEKIAIVNTFGNHFSARYNLNLLCDIMRIRPSIQNVKGVVYPFSRKMKREKYLYELKDDIKLISKSDVVYNRFQGKLLLGKPFYYDDAYDILSDQRVVDCLNNMLYEQHMLPKKRSLVHLFFQSGNHLVSTFLAKPGAGKNDYSVFFKPIG